MIEDTMRLIKHRRSVRIFDKKPVDYDTLTILLEAAMYAPSSHNSQPWHFVVCDDPAIIKELRKAHPYALSLETAPLCIAVVCAKAPKDAPDFGQQDGSAAVMNLMTAAAAMDLGSCWMGVSPRKELEEPIAALLELPSSLYPFALIALGYPAEQKPVPQRYKSEKIHINRW